MSAVEIISNYVDEINIAKMIVEDSIHIDPYYDIKMDFQESFEYLLKIQKFIKKKNITVKVLKDINKELRLKNYSKLKKQELLDKIRNYIYNKKYRLKKSKKMKELQSETSRIIQELLNKDFGTTVDDRIKKVLNIFECVKDNLFLLIYADDFKKVVHTKILELGPQIKDFNEKQYIKYCKLTEPIIDFINFIQ